jgi:putative membrane protein
MSIRSHLMAAAMFVTPLAFAAQPSTTQPGTGGSTGTGSTPTGTTGSGSMGTGSQTGGTMGTPGSTTQAQPNTNDPAQVAAKLHHVNQMEIDLGRLAEKNAQSKQVKTYAQKMVKDHTQAQTELTQLAKKSNISLDTAGSSPSASADMQKHQQLTQELTSLKGAEFDTRYMTEMTTGHQEAISFVESAALSLHGQEMGKWLTKMLPKLKQHQQEAQKIQQGLGGKAAGSR